MYITRKFIVRLISSSRGNVRLQRICMKPDIYVTGYGRLNTASVQAEGTATHSRVTVHRVQVSLPVAAVMRW